MSQGVGKLNGKPADGRRVELQALSTQGGSKQHINR